MAERRPLRPRGIAPVPAEVEAALRDTTRRLAADLDHAICQTQAKQAAGDAGATAAAYDRQLDCASRLVSWSQWMWAIGLDTEPFV